MADALLLADARATRPVSLAKATALLQDLQDMLGETAGDGGGALNEGRYLELCVLTRQLHDQLAGLGKEWGDRDDGWQELRDVRRWSVASDDDEFDNEALSSGWTIRRRRRRHGTTVVVQEYPVRIRGPRFGGPLATPVA